MKRMKKGLCIILTVSMLTAVSGCGKESGNKENSLSESGEITLRILENDTAKSEGYLDELLNAFNEKYKDKGIKAVDANMEEYSNLAENGPYGYGPDVIYQANDLLMSYAQDKHILALNTDDYECSEYTPPEAWDAFTLSVDGKQYVCGIPVNVQEPMLFYREDAIYEAAQIDGASNPKIFWKITLPLSKPILIYTALTSFAWPWSDFILPNMLLKNRDLWTVSVGLTHLGDTEFSRFAAGAILIAVPIVILYFSLSKFLIAGVSDGAVK